MTDLDLYDLLRRYYTRREHRLRSRAYAERDRLKKYRLLKALCQTRKDAGEVLSRLDGGPGSGNHNHAGVIGVRGGSAPGAGSLNGKIKEIFSSDDGEKERVKKFSSLLNDSASKGMQVTTTGSSNGHSHTFTRIATDGAGEGYWRDNETGFLMTSYELAKYADCSGENIPEFADRDPDAALQVSEDRLTADGLSDLDSGSYVTDAMGNVWQKEEDGSYSPVDHYYDATFSDEEIAEIGVKLTDREGVLDIEENRAGLYHEYFSRNGAGHKDGFDVPTIEPDDVARAAALDISQDTGLDFETSSEIVKAIETYTAVDCVTIRDAQAGGYYSEMGNLLEEYISNAPKWNGGELYRGIGVSEEEAEEYYNLAKSGGEFDQKGTSSWTSDYDVAQTFSFFQSSQGRIQVIFDCESGNLKGSSIEAYSSFIQEEVLVSKDSVQVATDVDYDRDAGILTIYCEEKS